MNRCIKARLKWDYRWSHWEEMKKNLNTWRRHGIHSREFPCADISRIRCDDFPQPGAYAPSIKSRDDMFSMSLRAQSPDLHIFIPWIFYLIPNSQLRHQAQEEKLSKSLPSVRDFFRRSGTNFQSLQFELHMYRNRF